MYVVRLVARPAESRLIVGINWGKSCGSPAINGSEKRREYITAVYGCGGWLVLSSFVSGGGGNPVS